MASINFQEIINYLIRSGQKDADQFVSITFDRIGFNPTGIVDEEFSNKVLDVQCRYGNVLIIERVA